MNGKNIIRKTVEMQFFFCVWHNICEYVGEKEFLTRKDCDEIEKCDFSIPWGIK